MIALPSDVRLVLASASPRRSDLLRSVGLSFEVRPADIDESVRTGEGPEDYVRRLAGEKAVAVSPGRHEIVIAADTTVALDGTVLGKPTDDADATRMLTALSGRQHLVHTGVAVANGTTVRTEVVTTTVRFVALDAAAVSWYVGTGEPDGKAGSYAVQGAGAALVAGVDGSVSNVIGLPLAETLALVRGAVDEASKRP